MEPVTRRALFVILALVFAAPAAAEEHRILFVGNSYTQYGGATNVAGCYGALAPEGVGAWDPVTHETIAKGGWTLHKHAQDAAKDGQALFDLLGEGDTSWDVVVYQEQSQIPGFHPYNAPDWDQSIAAAPTLDLYAAAAGAQTMFLMTWGRRDGDPMNAAIFPDYPTMQALLAEGYALYAAEASTPERQAWVAPVGLAWQAVWDAGNEAGDDPLDPDHLFHRLYSGDGSHPSQLGSYLMGLAMYASITGRSLDGLTWVPDGTSAGDAAALEAATRRAILTPPFATVDHGWGPLHALPWLQRWEDAAASEEAGTVTISHPTQRRTAVVTGDASATTIVLGGAEGAMGRLVLQDDGALVVEAILAGDGGSGAVHVHSGTLSTPTVEVPVTLTGGGWILPASGDGATLSADLALGEGAVLRFDLGAPPGAGAPNGHLTVGGTASLDGRIYVVAGDDLEVTAPTTWDLLAAPTITTLPSLELDAPDGATMEVVEDGPGQILRVTLVPEGTPPVEPTPDVVTGEDVVTEELVEEVVAEDTAAAQDAAPDTGAHPDTPGHETPTPQETAGPDVVAEPAPPSGGGGGGCGVGSADTAWWLVLIGIAGAWCSIRRNGRTGVRARPTSS